VLASLAGLSLLLVAAQPAHGFDPTKDRETHLLSRSMIGGFPNGPSRNAKFSKDGQGTRLAAFESDASDLVPGDSNGRTDVFVVRRGGDFTTNKGEPWQPAGPAQLVSVGLRRQPANGSSYMPDLDGSALDRRPHCVAFVSRASNLVPGDTNGKADAFVRDLRSGETRRVSEASSGAQSNGTTFDVQMDGECSRVAFTSDASNLYLARSDVNGNPFRRSLVTAAPRTGSKQVYVHLLNGKGGDNVKLDGVTFLASASDRGIPGRRDSYDVSLGQLGGGCRVGRCGTTSGDSLSFTSDAENLTRGDHNGQPDVYQRDFHRPVLSAKQRNQGKRSYLVMKTTLVSANPSGRAGDGASSHSAINDRGSYVAFETLATDLVSGDTNNASDVLMRGLHENRNRATWRASAAKMTGPANAGSYNPTITSPASILFYESDASNLQPNPIGSSGLFHDRNCARDIFFWNNVSTNASLQSRDSDQHITNLPEDSNRPVFEPCPPIVASGSSNPASSYYGNYFLWESAYPLFDLPLAERAFPELTKSIAAAAKRSHTDYALHQVYLRYNGPKAARAKFPPSTWPLPKQGEGAPG
jgi:hypothetical protein